MRIAKWKPVQDWTPTKLTTEQIESFICNKWYFLPNNALPRLRFTVVESGLLRHEVVVPYDQLSQWKGRDRKLDPKHNQIVISELSVKIMEIIHSAVNLSVNEPLTVFLEIIYKMDEPRTSGSTKPEIWLFKGDVYLVTRSGDEAFYSTEQVALLMLEFYDKDRRKWEELNRKYRSDDVERESHHRERIPEDVRISVWRRDGGKCAHCGNREKLEYDHIVPLSKGGSNTARNIELLCEKCNREKGARTE